jgi:hypothetical protein
LQPSSQRLARYRWRVLLPIVMCVVSVFLMARAKPTPFNSGVEAPERIINSLINGPGFYLTGHLRFPIHALNEPLGDNTNRLFGIVGFWFLIGLSIDRRRNGQRLGSYHPIPAGILFTFGLLVCGLLGIGMALALCDRITWRLIIDYPLRTTHSMELGLMLWMAALCAYFGRRVFIAARQSLVQR